MPPGANTETTPDQMSSLKKEVPRFIVAGCLAVTTDFLTYFALLTFLSHAPAKAISFIAGTGVAYLLNKFWTFKKHERNHLETVKFVILYTSTLGANVLVNQTVLYLFPTYVLLAFLLATGTSTVLNFIGQKWWVFK